MQCFWSSVVISLCLAFSAADIEFHRNSKFYYSTFIGLETKLASKNLSYFRCFKILKIFKIHFFKFYVLFVFFVNFVQIIFNLIS